MEDEIYDAVFPGDDDMRGSVPGHNRALQDRLAERAIARGVGRPAKPDADKRTRRLVLLTTDAEESAILARVPPGRNFSDWAREKLLSE